MPIFGQKYYRMGNHSWRNSFVVEISKAIHGSSEYGRSKIYCRTFSKQGVCIFKTALARISLSCQHDSVLRFQGYNSDDHEPSPATKMHSIPGRLPLRPQCHKVKPLRYEFLSGALQPADMFTKPLPFVTLSRHMKEVGFGNI